MSGTSLVSKYKDERGQAQDREVLVHFQGWKPRWDEWIGVSDGKLARVQDAAQVRRADLLAAWNTLEGYDDAEDTYRVDHLVAKRMVSGRAQYLVRW